MKRPLSIKPWWVLAACVGAVAPAALGGQVSLTPAPKNELQSSAPGNAAANEWMHAVVQARSKMEFLRRLVLMSPEDRDKVLQQKSPEQRQFLRNRLREFDALNSVEREAQLRGLDLRAYLRPLMKMTPSQRKEALLLVPESVRLETAERLDRWDQLRPDLQRDVIDHERTMHYVLRLEGLSTPERKRVPMPDSLKHKWEDKLEEWRGLPPERRARVYAQFQKFFELSPKERARVLETLPQDERVQLQESVDAFAKMQPVEVRARLESLRRITEMEGPQRQQFLDTLQRWHAMSERERSVWKNLTTVLPPGYPPLPPEAVPSRPPPRGGTNPGVKVPGSDWLPPVPK